VEVSELVKRVRHIEIKTRSLSNNVFAGEYHSAFKGRGMSFAEVREYQIGDDVRDIDWNVTARTNRPHIKIYEEERELTVMMLVDVSGSLNFGSELRTQRELVTEIAATIAFSALQNNDKVGMVLFSNKVEKYIPPKKGRKHILYLIRELLNFEPTQHNTDISCGLEFLMQVQRRHSIVFLLSDFIDTPSFEKQLSIATHKHDIVGVKVYDQRMKELPNVGLMKLQDAESGTTIYVDTSSNKVREQHNLWWNTEAEKLESTLRKTNVNYVSISTSEDYVKPLQLLFKSRHR
jgi:uncharacterized protein (DUF58 family)